MSATFQIISYTFDQYLPASIFSYQNLVSLGLPRCVTTKFSGLIVAAIEQQRSPGAILLNLAAYTVPRFTEEGHNSQEKENLANALFVQGGHLHRQINNYEQPLHSPLTQFGMKYI
jgi:hypothetical protein